MEVEIRFPPVVVNLPDECIAWEEVAMQKITRKSMQELFAGRRIEVAKDKRIRVFFKKKKEVAQ